MNTLLNGNSTFLDLVNGWLGYVVKHDYSKSTYASYASKLGHLSQYVGHIKLNELTKEKLQRTFMLIESAKFSPNTLYNIYSITKKVLNFAIQIGAVKENVTDNLVLPKRKPYMPKVYHKVEVTRLLSLTKDSKLEIPVTLAVNIGLRRGEILSLQWKDIDFMHNTILVNKGTSAPDIGDFTKSESSIRLLKLPKKVSKMLQDHLLEQKKSFLKSGITHDVNTLLFCKKDATRYNATSLSKMFKKFLTDNKLPVIRFHDLRHTYATIAHNGGMPLKHLSRSLGHSTPAITVEQYVHI